MMTKITLTISLLFIVGCGGVAQTLTSPSPPVTVAAPVAPTVLRAWFGAGTFAGGATQVHATMMGYDASGTLVRVPDVEVSFASDRERLTVLHHRTSATEDAVALLEVGPSRQRYVVNVTVEGAGLSQVVTVPVAGSEW